MDDDELLPGPEEPGWSVMGQYAGGVQWVVDGRIGRKHHKGYIIKVALRFRPLPEIKV